MGLRSLLTVNLEQNLLVHRSDLHSELQRLAVGPGNGPPAVLHLSSKVIDCDPDEGLLTLGDGRVISSDLILGADGIAVRWQTSFQVLILCSTWVSQSSTRTRIVGQVIKSIACGFSTHRALIEMSRFEGMQEMDWLREGVSGPRNVVKQSPPFRMLFMYPCRGGTLLNVAAIIQDPHQDDPGQLCLPKS